MTPLERAARAMAERRGEQLAKRGASTKSVEQYADERWQDFTDDVRVVLQAIREPSEAMIYANSEGGLGFNDRVINDWKAMIDAALEEG